MADILWADVGERLNLSVREMRGIRSAFGDVLGLGLSKELPEHMLPAIDYVAKRRKEQASDDDIRQELSSSKRDLGWPEEVLSRMDSIETATTAEEQIAATTTLDGDPVITDEVERIWAEYSETSSSRPRLFLIGGETGSTTDEKESGETLDESQVLTDLRMELHTHLASQREDILRLELAIRKLSMEVRDMRYALMLGFTRRDRKKGYKGMSNLLLG